MRTILIFLFPLFEFNNQGIIVRFEYITYFIDTRRLEKLNWLRNNVNKMYNISIDQIMCLH